MRARIEKMARERAEQLIRASTGLSGSADAAAEDDGDSHTGSHTATTIDGGAHISMQVSPGRDVELRAELNAQRARVEVEAAATAASKRRAMERALDKKAFAMEEAAIQRVRDLQFEADRVRGAEEEESEKARLQLDADARRRVKQMEKEAKTRVDRIAQEVQAERQVAERGRVQMEREQSLVQEQLAAARRRVEEAERKMKMAEEEANKAVFKVEHDAMEARERAEQFQRERRKEDEERYGTTETNDIFFISSVNTSRTV